VQADHHHMGAARLVEPVASVAEQSIHADRAEVRGPHPVLRGMFGLLLGVVAGILAALLTARQGAKRTNIRASRTKPSTSEPLTQR
jgi:hypothetical protein